MTKQIIEPIHTKAAARNWFPGRLNFQLPLLCCLLTFAATAQSALGNDPIPAIKIGDTAPSLYVRQWLKGKPITEFKNGKFYVLEFWATWCAPCKAAMPHLSALARKYKNSATFLSIDVMEQKTTSLLQIKHFVDSMGQKMDYNVAAEDSNFMTTGWLDATGEKDKGIPRVFVVNGAGKLAWMGHPKDLSAVLPKIICNNWDLQEALFSYNEERRLAAIDRDVMYDILNFTKSPNRPRSQDKPDSLLLTIAAIVKKDPKLKYAPSVTAYTFTALLKTNMHKAYEYGKEGLQTNFFGDSPAYFIMGNIDSFADSLQLTPEIYQLGIEACQVEIDQTVYPELASVYKIYNRMADWYWRINEPSKAIITQQKAIASLKSRQDFTDNQLAALELRLNKYRQNQGLQGLKQL